MLSIVTLYQTRRWNISCPLISLIWTNTSCSSFTLCSRYSAKYLVCLIDLACFNGLFINFFLCWIEQLSNENFFYLIQILKSLIVNLFITNSTTKTKAANKLNEDDGIKEAVFINEIFSLLDKKEFVSKIEKFMLQFNDNENLVLSNNDSREFYFGVSYICYFIHLHSKLKNHQSL